MSPEAWVALISAVVSALGAGTVLWVRLRDRPEAEWHFSKFDFPMTDHATAYLKSYHGEMRPHLTMECRNIGDGAAYAVSVRTVGCEAAIVVRDMTDRRGFRTPVVEPRVATGDGIGVLLWFNEHPRPSLIRFDLDWTSPPTRQHRRRTDGLLLRSPDRADSRDARLWRRLQWWRHQQEPWVLNPEDPVARYLD